MPLDNLLSATFEVFGLSVQAAWREEARAVLGVIADAARLVQSADLGDHAEPAAVYLP